MTFWDFFRCGSEYNPPSSPTPDDAPIHKLASPLKSSTVVNRVTPGENDKFSFVTEKPVGPTSRKLGGTENTSYDCESRPTPKSATPREDVVPANVTALLGFDRLERLKSAKWEDRREAIDSTRDLIEQGAGSSADLLESGSYVVMRTAADRVLPVYLSSLELVKCLLCDLSTKPDLDAELLARHVAAMIPLIVAKTSDRNARVIEATHGALLAIGKAPQVGCRGLMLPVLTPVANTKAYVHALKGRLQLLEMMIEEFSFSKSSGLSLSAVMSYVRPHLEATDEKVRMAAVEVTVSCYYHKGERTMQYVQGLKPATMKLLEGRFAEVGQRDSKKSKSKKHGGKRADKLPSIRGQNGKRNPLPGLSRKPGSRQSDSSSSSTALSRQSSSAGSSGSLGSQKADPLLLASRGGLSSPQQMRMSASHSWTKSDNLFSLEAPAHQDPMEGTLDALSRNALDSTYDLRGMGADLLSPPVPHGRVTEDPMRAGPAPENHEEGDDFDDFERAERLMDEIEGLY